VLVLAAVATAVMIHTNERSAQQSTGSVGIELANTISATDSAFVDKHQLA
jgi:hypothetical protein